MQKPWIWTSLCCDTLAVQLNILSIKLNGRATCHLLCKGRTQSEPHISFSPLNIFEKNGRQGSDTNWTWGIREIAVTFTQKQLTFSVSDTCINLDPFPNGFRNDPSLTFSHCHLLLTSSLAGAPSVCSSSVWRWSWALIYAHLSWLISLILSPPQYNLSRDCLIDCRQQQQRRDVVKLTFDLYKNNPKDFIGCLNVKATLYGVYTVSYDLRCYAAKKMLKWVMEAAKIFWYFCILCWTIM